MERDYLLLPNIEFSGFSEKRLDKKIDTQSNTSGNTQGSILFSSLPIAKKKPFRWIRVRSFFTKHRQFKRLIEFSIHPSGVHLLRQAIFYSDNGCQMCKVYVEKNLF